MRKDKNNITCNIGNITLNYKILTAHFTGKGKIITLSSIILILSFANIISNIVNISALSYESSVGIGFTFNPTLSINLSSSDLIIPNLTPGSSADSNSINVSVATNAAYGYTLSANVGSNDSSSPYYNSSDLILNTNNSNVFSSIATNADLVSLTTDNTWGYSTSLDNGSSWNNYNGLYSSTSTTLIDNSNTADSTGNIDFKIGAKASSTQASGIYTNTITFAAVTKPTPITLAEAYASEGKTMVNGFYTMQDMTSTICSRTEAIGSQLQVLDIRDYKVYWIAKLADNHCWMTQNLDLDLDSTRTYTHWDTDLGWSIENGNSIDENASWQPVRSTINFTIGSTIPGWQRSDNEPYSANPGDVYFYTSNSNADDIQYNSLQECQNAGHIDCNHYHTGNYYNWPAAGSSNNTSELTGGNAPNSVCPRGWKLFSVSEIAILLSDYKILDSYSSSGFIRVGIEPLYFVRSGRIMSTLQNITGAYYWTNTLFSRYTVSFALFGKTAVYPGSARDGMYMGTPVRCLAR